MAVSEAGSQQKGMTQSLVKLSPLRSRYDHGDFVHVLVGPTKQDFGIHKGLLCHHSRFFVKAFNGSFSEASKRIVELPEDNVGIFSIVYTWLYSGQLLQAKDGEDVACSSDQIVDLFVFGDKYDMSTLCNTVVDWIIDRFEKENRIPNSSTIAPAYEKTLPGSNLRKAVLITWTYYPERMAKLLENRGEILMKCPEFLLDFSKAVVEGYDKPRPSSVREIPDKCQYHRHDEGEGRCT
ncbi:hypothetical protein P7C71_g2538, partial [Lecanoromycetidae sp. Uapishka_2]